MTDRSEARPCGAVQARHRASGLLRPFVLKATLLCTVVSFAPQGAVQAQAADTPVDAGSASQAERRYDVAPGPLATALNQYVQAAGVLISFDAGALEGLRSPGVQGSYSVAEGFRQVLRGSGFEAVATGPGRYGLRAAPAGQARMLEEVTVRGGLDATTEGTASYAASGVTMMKGAQSLKDIPQSLTVVTRKRMDDQNLNTLTDVLANTPGITLNRVVGGGSSIISRGFTIDTIEYGGVPLPRTYTNGNLFAASTVYLDRVEVLRGAQGLLEGAGSPAGAVNLVRKRGLDQTAYTIEGRLGSWDRYGTRVDAGGPLNDTGTLRGRAVVDYEKRRSFVDKISDRDFNAYAALDADLSERTTVGFGISYSRIRGNSNIYYGLPRYTDGTAVPLPRGANLDADWSHVDRRETQVFLDLEHRFNQNWKLEASGVYIDERYGAQTALSYFSLIPIGGNTLTAPGFAYDFGGKSKGVDVSLSGKLQGLGMRHEVIVGANYGDQTRDDAFDEYSSTTVDVFDYSRPIPGLDTRVQTRTRSLTRKISQKGIYGLWRSHLTDRLTVLAGGRVSWYRYRNAIVNPVTGAFVTRNQIQEDHKFTPYAGLVYALTPEWSAYASYAEIFEPQSEMDVNLQMLPPRTGINYEVGLKGELLDGALTASLALYRVEQKNRAVTDYNAPPVCGDLGGSYCSRASGKVRSEGLDVELHGRITPGWQVSAGYTYSRNKYLEDQDASLVGKPFSPLMPRHMLRVWTEYRLPDALWRWSVGAGVNYRSKQRSNESDMLNPVQNGYAVWNARVAYQINDRWSAALNIDNVFDKRYYYSISENYLHNYVGAPRNFLLTVRGRF